MDLNALVGQLNSFWQKFGTAQKTAIIALVATLVIGLAAVGFWASKPSYSLLYSKISQEDASAIVQQLEDLKIPFKLSHGGTTISVPSEHVYSTRLKMAGEGLPKGDSTGYELFDKNLIGLTDFMQKVNYIRALQGELGRTISEINEVENVRVHVVIPEEALFEKNQKEPTASIIVTLKPGQFLDKEQIGGIRYLVASSVVGLKPTNITIIDNNGNVLSHAKEENSMDQINKEQLEAQKNVDRYLEAKVQSMLDAVLGQGKAVVKVTAELNFKKVQQTIESFDPDSAVVRRENIQNQKRSETPAQLGGTPGVKPNVTIDTNAAGVGGKNMKDSKESIQNEYEIDRTIQQVVNQIGNINRLSVAVFIDQKLNPETGEPLARTAQEMTSITNMVKAAVGYQNDPLKGRVDDIAIQETSFNTSVQDAQTLQMKRSQQIQIAIEVGQYVGKALVGLLMLGMIYMLFKGSFETGSETDKLTTAHQPSLPEKPKLSMAQLEYAVMKGMPDLQEGEEGVKQLEQYLTLLAQERTPEFVHLVKSWIHNPNMNV